MKIAIETGHPAFSKPLHVGIPYLEGEVRSSFHRIMDEVFDRAILTNDGPCVQAFEERVRTLHQVEQCIAVSNGTMAQILLLNALGIKGEVILPSFTFIATAHAVHWNGLRPVFCDIHPQTLTLDCDHVAKKVTSDTSAIIGVHVFGSICDVQGLQRICQTHGLELLFDAAHAFGSSLEGVAVGGFGRAEFLSFHATKFFSTFEGGGILTNDNDLARELRKLRSFGVHGTDRTGSIGINAKMSEAGAALGLASFSVLEQRIVRLKWVHHLYHEHLNTISGIRMLTAPPGQMHSHQYAVCLVDDSFGLSRDQLCAALWLENCFCRRYFYPGCHRMEPYNSLYPHLHHELPVTEAIGEKILCLPVNLVDPEHDVKMICDLIHAIQNRADVVRNWSRDDSVLLALR
ncbi:MAG: DegT/DnrJ/EryC1/StrS family aminotransferase [Magnetococcales bacterium]|nr:DegT/DnrJ/EryC1/StrS family aminotransferase [Magnetococcales bacterium]MBF0151070.1 DegT/DnrJ/EryC1/StrS family aminotransferase [Magnetococcales bacterium]MBF0631598.1 DegT/DnrJ/EryC1/StrS family aminotransferase [Magnetococcales bacterium]